MWYDLRNDAKSAEDCPPGDETYTFGLLDYYYTPKKAYYAAAAFNKLTAGMELSSSDFSETVDNYSIVQSGQYNAKYTNSSGSAVNVLWNAYGTSTVNLPVSGIKAVVYDLYGNAKEEYQLGGGTSTISVATSTEPVYVLSVSAVDMAVSERGETVTTIFSDDFSYSGTDAMKNGAKWDISDEANTIAVENGVFSIKASADTSKASPSITSKLTENIEKGHVRISFDMNIPSGDLSYKTLFALYDQNNVQQNVFVAERGGDGNPVINMNGISEPVTWAGLQYDTNYRFVIDLNVGENEQNFYMTVYDKCDNSIAARFYKKGYANAWIFKNIRFMSWGTGRVLIDNVTIETISPKLAMSDNFNGYNSLYSASAAKIWNVSSSGTGFEQIDSAHGLTAYSSGYSTFAPHRLDRERTSGTLSIEFDTYLKDVPSWMTVAMGSYTDNDFGANQILYIQKDNNSSDILLYAAGTEGQFVTLSTGRWYTVKMTVDFDNDTVKASVYDGGVLIGTSEGITGGNYSALNFMADNSSKFYFDNVKISDGSDLRVESTTVTVKKNNDTDKATGLLTKIINVGTTAGIIGSVRYNITSDGVTKSFTKTGNKTVTIEPNGYAYVALVIDGLYDKNAEVDVEIN